MLDARPTLLLTALVALCLLAGPSTADLRAVVDAVSSQHSATVMLDSVTLETVTLETSMPDTATPGETGFETDAGAPPGGFSDSGTPPQITSRVALATKGSETAADQASPVVPVNRVARFRPLCARAELSAPATPLYLSHCAFLC